MLLAFSSFVGDLIDTESVPDLLFDLFWFRALSKIFPLESLSCHFLFVIAHWICKQIWSVFSSTSTVKECAQVNFHDCRHHCYCRVHCHCHSLLLQLVLHITIKESKSDNLAFVTSTATAIIN